MTAATKVVFTPIPQFDIIKEWELPSFSTKLAREHAVRAQGNELVNYILDCFPSGERRVVDVKVQHLELHHTTCQAGWHKDVEFDSEAEHHLFVLGINRTEFLIDDEVVRMPEGHFASYGSSAKHRGPEVIESETRLLIRATKSVMIAGNSQIEDKYKYVYPIGGKGYVRI